jgi:hypothetical protein
MDNPRRPRGRPPGPTQTVPLFLHQVRSRVKTRLVISTVIEHELRAYVPWAARHVMMAADEILVRVVDRALDEYFKRDKLWRKERDAVLSEAEFSRWRTFKRDSTAAPEAEEAEDGTVAIALDRAPTLTAQVSPSDPTAATAPASRSKGPSR